MFTRMNRAATMTPVAAKTLRILSLAVGAAALALVLEAPAAWSAAPGAPAPDPAPATGDSWLEAYRQAIVHAELEEWSAVQENVRAAIRLNPKPQRNVRIYGMWHTSYTPYYFLGLAEYRQGRYAQALESFRKEDESGVIQHDPVAYLKMQKLIASADSGPPAPPSPGKAAPLRGSTTAAAAAAPDPGPVIAGLQAFFKSDYDGSIASFQEAMKERRGSDLTLHLYLGMAYAGKASADKERPTIWENLAFLEFQRVHDLDPGYKLSPGIFSEEMMDLFDRARGGK